MDRLSSLSIDQIIAIQEGKGIVPRKFPSLLAKSNNSKWVFAAKKFVDVEEINQDVENYNL